MHEDLLFLFKRYVSCGCCVCLLHVGMLEEDREQCLFLLWDSYGHVSFFIVSYVFTYISLKHPEAFGNGYAGIKTHSY